MSDQGVKTLTFGNTKDFDRFEPLQPIRSVGMITLSSGGLFRGLDFNGELVGTFGSLDSDSFFLEDDEFVTEVTGSYSEERITSLNIATSFGKVQRGGTVGAEDQTFSVSGGEVSAMGFFLDQFSNINAIQFYQQPIDQAETAIVEDQALAVVGIIPQFQTVTTFTSSELTKLNSASQLQDKQFSSSVTGRVKTSTRVGFKLASAKFSTSVSRTSNSKSLDRATLTTELEDNEITSEQVTISIPEGFVGLEVVDVQRLRESDGFEWLYPIGSPQLITVRVEDALANERFYDTTGVLRTMLPGVDGERLLGEVPFPFYEKGEPLVVLPRESAANSSSTPALGVLGGICAALVLLVALLVVKNRKIQRRTSIVEDILQSATHEGSRNPMVKVPPVSSSFNNNDRA